MFDVCTVLIHLIALICDVVEAHATVAKTVRVRYNELSRSNDKRQL